MAKKIIILYGLLICYGLVKAQTDSTKIKNSTIYHSPKQSMENPIFLINGRQMPDENIINYLKRLQDIKYVSIPLNEKSGFGRIVVSFTLKPNVKLLSLQELFKKFNIKKTDWELSVYVNNERLTRPDEFYVGSRWVKKITVMTAPTAEINEQKYIVLSK